MWQIANIQFYPNFILSVYNRWGMKVHEQKGSFTPWDGTSFGNPVPDASYYYVLIPDKKDKNNGIIKGAVTIIR